MLSRLARRRLVRLAKKFFLNQLEQCQGDSLVLKRNTSASGLYSFYFQLTETVGLKVFRDTYSAKRAVEKFVRQRKAWRLGFAPYCFGLFVVDGYTCHLTETITVAQSFAGQLFGTQDEANKTMKKIKHVQRVLWNNIKFPFSDSHCGNWGRRSPQRNQVLCLDFDF